MPLSLKRGSVTRVVDALHCEVDGIGCTVYPAITGPVEAGDDVLVNVQARELGLGSGGFDIVYANLTRGLGLPAAEAAHVMVLPYTPLQYAVRHVEEDGPLAESLDGLPVVCCSLHSQVVPVCAGLEGARVFYVQLEGGALPVVLSDALRALRGLGLLDTAVAVSPCSEGDVQAVNVYSALAWCKAQGAGAVVCAVGPGIVGTGTSLGHGGVAAAQAANAAAALGGRAVIAQRLSDADERERHRGVSHHTEAVLRLCLAEPLVPSVDDGEGWREACAGLPLSHMGRGPAEEPSFFAAAFAAGRAARRLVP
ncbi:MAG: DUF3866 family protein [Gaiellaceae bacterium]